jgi:putative NADH-flavin reductase
MRLLILGGTGKTGNALITQALDAGHQVTVFGRSSLKGFEPCSNLKTWVGNPMLPQELGAVTPDHDAVISVLGTRGLGTTTVLVDGARSTIEAMRSGMVKRLVILSSSLVDLEVGLFTGIASRTVFRHTTNDQEQMEKLVTGSDLEWTIFRPARTTNGTLTRHSEVITGSEPGKANSKAVSRQDVAHRMLGAVETGNNVRQTVWLRG